MASKKSGHRSAQVREGRIKVKTMTRAGKQVTLTSYTVTLKPGRQLPGKTNRDSLIFQAMRHKHRGQPRTKVKYGGGRLAHRNSIFAWFAKVPAGADFPHIMWTVK